MLSSLVVVLVLVAAPPAPPPAPAPVVGPAIVVIGLDAAEIPRRLAALDPARPVDYFELAESLADGAVATDAGREHRALARTLLVLAVDLGRRRAETGDAQGLRLAASACLLLAELAEKPGERRWLTAMAAALASEAPDAPPPNPLVPPGQSEADAVQLAGALGLLRAGDGRRAAKILTRPEVARLLRENEGLLSPSGERGLAAKIQTQALERPNCPECRNRRFTKGREGVRLCGTCGGRPGPKLSKVELLYQLRLESLLLSGVQRTWAGQVLADDGAPLRDLDPDELAATYGVDVNRTVWRAGSWTGPTK
jgi:hypothetical protein